MFCDCVSDVGDYISFRYPMTLDIKPHIFHFFRLPLLHHLHKCDTNRLANPIIIQYTIDNIEKMGVPGDNQ